MSFSSIISSLILQRLAPVITAFVVVLNSIAGVFGAAPVIPYNPERTDVVVSGEITTDVDEILEYYNAAVKKTNKSFVIGSSSAKINGTPEVIVDGEPSDYVDDTYWSAFEESTSTVFKIPGNGEVLAADVESAKMSVNDGKRSIIIDIVDVNGDAPGSAIERVYGTAVGIAEGLNSFGYLTVDEKNVSISYTDSTVSCIIDDNSGKIIYGDWDSTGSVVATDITSDMFDFEFKMDKIAFSMTTSIDV